MFYPQPPCVTLCESRLYQGVNYRRTRGSSHFPFYKLIYCQINLVTSEGTTTQRMFFVSGLKSKNITDYGISESVDLSKEKANFSTAEFEPDLAKLILNSMRCYTTLNDFT